MAKNNMTCFLCGTSYNYCPTCSKDKDKASWHKLFHSETCKNINTILSDYNYNRITIDKAKSLLLKEGANKLVVKDADIKKVIKKILSHKKEVVEVVPEKKIETENSECD